jgi:hypothetical protein
MQNKKKKKKKNSIERCHVGQQGLSSADVRRCFVSSDVLLPRLHRHAQRWFTSRIS